MRNTVYGAVTRQWFCISSLAVASYDTVIACNLLDASNSNNLRFRQFSMQNIVHEQNWKQQKISLVWYILCKIVINVLFQKLQSPILDGFTLHNRESASKRVSFCGRWALDVTMDRIFFLKEQYHFQSIEIILGPSDAWSMRRSTQRPSVLY